MRKIGAVYETSGVPMKIDSVQHTVVFVFNSSLIASVQQSSVVSSAFLHSAAALR
jgi:hypothetical protein